MTERGRQNWNTAGVFTVAVALMTIGSGIWRLSAGFTTATSQHEQMFQQNAHLLDLTLKNSEEQRKNSEEIVKVLNEIGGKLDKKCK